MIYKWHHMDYFVIFSCLKTSHQTNDRGQQFDMYEILIAGTIKDRYMRLHSACILYKFNVNAINRMIACYNSTICLVGSVCQPDWLDWWFQKRWHLYGSNFYIFKCNGIVLWLLMVKRDTWPKMQRKREREKGKK